jgi:hypothetical protein
MALLTTPMFTIIGIVPIDWNNGSLQSVKTNTARIWLHLF